MERDPKVLYNNIVKIHVMKLMIKDVEITSDTPFNIAQMIAQMSQDLDELSSYYE